MENLNWHTMANCLKHFLNKDIQPRQARIYGVFKFINI